MATIYDLQAQAGDLHRELSFDVDGRFARVTGFSGTEVDGVLHLVVSLTTEREDAEPAEPAEEVTHE